MADFICCQYVKVERRSHGRVYDWQFNYLFAKQVTEDEYKAIERQCLDSDDYGAEVSGKQPTAT